MMKFFTILMLCLVAGAQVPQFKKTPFELASPASPSRTHGQQDLNQLSPRALRNEAKKYYRNGDYKEAIQFQHWSCQKNPDAGMYYLASYYALNKNMEAAVYFLQKAAMKEGLLASWIRNDENFMTVVKSIYWKELEPWLEDCTEKWNKSSYLRVSMIEPKGESKILLLGLHGYASKPEDFTMEQDDQVLADELGVTIVSVSASIPMGVNSFRWSEDIHYDYEHITKALKTVNIDLNKSKGQLILIGFSQGGQLSAELMARHPDMIKSIIALCPGGRKGAQFDKVNSSHDLTANRAVIISGSEESKNNIEMAKADLQYFKDKGCQVRYKMYQGMGHSFPTTYYSDLRQWLSFLTEK